MMAQTLSADDKSSNLPSSGDEVSLEPMAWHLQQDDPDREEEETMEVEEASASSAAGESSPATTRMLIADFIHQKLKTVPLSWSTDEIVEAVVKVWYHRSSANIHTECPQYAVPLGVTQCNNWNCRIFMHNIQTLRALSRARTDDGSLSPPLPGHHGKA